ncbi:hypothetical protein LCGC14_0526900 [marine sediment metagenome]|uniref:DUF4234 domain-containing protein n=1 Tax=marine sediment metagenome TaxID=412755 RepID=A0A0F9V4Z4_9ZZZZ|nr:DUF4234 domain-containing protein [Actinomycetota bacterium]
MQNNYQKLQRIQDDAVFTDRRLINWWLFLILTIITAGIFYVIEMFIRMFRRDTHFDRMQELFETYLDITKDASIKTGIDVSDQIAKIEGRLKQAQFTLLRPKHALLWAILIPLTGGLVNLYTYYFLMVDWYDIQTLEQEMMHEFSSVWYKLGITQHRIKVRRSLPQRNYWLYLFLSIITLGIWALYWDYVIHTDPDLVFVENRIWETMVIENLRQADIQKAA